METTCKSCKFGNKKKVVQPSKHIFCECKDAVKYQMVIPEIESCKKFTAKS